MFDRRGVIEAFDAIGTEALANGTRLDLAVHGGAALMLASNNPAFLGGFTDIGSPMPELHIIVSPSPPLDYLVLINERRYAATSRSIYAVTGPVSIIVRRAGKPDCSWSGTATLEKSQDITCTF